QSQVAFVDEILERNPETAVFTRHGDDESEVARDEQILVLGPLLLEAGGQLGLLLARQGGVFADIGEVPAQVHGVIGLRPWTRPRTSSHRSRLPSRPFLPQAPCRECSDDPRTGNLLEPAARWP